MKRASYVGKTDAEKHCCQSTFDKKQYLILCIRVCDEVSKYMLESFLKR